MSSDLLFASIVFAVIGISLVRFSVQFRYAEDSYSIYGERLLFTRIMIARTSLSHRYLPNSRYSTVQQNAAHYFV